MIALWMLQTAAAYLIELDDVRMADLLEYLDLSGDPLHVLLVLDLLLLQNLDSNLKHHCYLK